MKLSEALILLGIMLLCASHASLWLSQARMLRWVRRELEKNVLAHGRIVAALPGKRRRKREDPFPLVHKDWGDSRLATARAGDDDYLPPFKW